jgi:serine/threonine protein kinase
VVRLYDSFVYARSLWVVMQLCDGPTLRGYMHQAAPGMDVTLSVTEQLADALSYMRNENTAHRDLKPDNIIVLNGFHVKVCDFGLARLVAAGATDSVSSFAGTRCYMPPQMFEEERRYDPFKVDIFSMGLIILAMITFVPGQQLEHFFYPGKT